MLGYILDAIILIIIGMTIFFSMKRGLVKTAINAVSLTLAAILSIFLSPIVENLFDEKWGEKREIAVYFIVFIVLWIIIKIVANLLDKIISAIPIIRSLNTASGAILGVLLGVFRISVYCVIIGTIISLETKFDISFLSKINIDDTIIFKFFYEYNPLNLLINFILK